MHGFFCQNNPESSLSVLARALSNSKFKEEFIVCFDDVKRFVGVVDWHLMEFIKGARDYKLDIPDVVKCTGAYCHRGDGLYDPVYFPGADIETSDLGHVGILDHVTITGKYASQFGLPPEIRDWKYIRTNDPRSTWGGWFFTVPYTSVYIITLLDAGGRPCDQDDIANVYIDTFLQTPQFNSVGFSPPYDWGTETGGKREEYTVAPYAGYHTFLIEIVYSEIGGSLWGIKVEGA